MSENVYEHFSDGEIKAFATQKEVKPHKFSGRLIRKMLPLLASSVMMFSSIACSRGTEKTDKEGYVDCTNLTSEMIIDMMTNPDNVLLLDLDYNHSAKDGKNYWNVVNQGLNIIKKLDTNSNLSKDEILMYKKVACDMLADVKIINGVIANPDLSDAETMKSFLFFEKVVRYKDNYKKIFADEPGVYNEQDDLFGRNYKDCYALIKKAKNNPGVVKFADALYNDASRFIISKEDSVKANEISRFILKKWLQNNNLKSDNLYEAADVDDDNMTNKVAFYLKRGNDLRIKLKIDSTGDLGDGCYSPVGVTVIHELLHVTQKKPSSNQDFRENANIIEELGPTLNSLVLDDMIYKTMHKIPMNNVVNYGDLEIGKTKVPVGELAVWFRKMCEKYPRQSIDKVLCEDEVFDTLVKIGNQEKVNLLNKNIGRANYNSL